MDTQTVSTALQFRPRTYAETLPEMLEEQAGLLADVDAGARWVAENITPPPAPGELFVIFGLTTWGGWRAIYLNWSSMTRFLAVRCARAAVDPNVRELKIFRGSPEEILPALRLWRQQNGVKSLNVL